MSVSVTVNVSSSSVVGFSGRTSTVACGGVLPITTSAVAGSPSISPSFGVTVTDQVCPPLRNSWAMLVCC